MDIGIFYITYFTVLFSNENRIKCSNTIWVEILTFKFVHGNTLFRYVDDINKTGLYFSSYHKKFRFWNYRNSSLFDSFFAVGMLPETNHVSDRVKKW